MKVKYNAPVTLNLTFLSLLVLLLGFLFKNFIANYFILYGGISDFSFSNVFQILPLFTYVLVHESFRHLLGNFTIILLLGSILEEKYGSMQLLVLILITALSTGLIHLFLFSNGLLGASGIAFMMIILSSITNVKNKELPLTFVLIFSIYISNEFFNMFEKNNIAEFGHILGGICGAIYGFIVAKNKKFAL